MSIDKVGVMYLLRGSPCLQYTFFNAKNSSIVVSRRQFGKTTIFLIFYLKMRDLSLNITNKRHIRSDRGMSAKRNAILAYSS